MALNWLAKGARGLFLCACECLCVGVWVCVRRQCVIAAAVKGRQPDVEMEQCENGSHNGGTSLASGGVLEVLGGGVCVRVFLKKEKSTT